MIRSPNGLPSWQQRHKRDADGEEQVEHEFDDGLVFEDEIKADMHVVFRRKDSSAEHLSDYREFDATESINVGKSCTNPSVFYSL